MKKNNEITFRLDRTEYLDQSKKEIADFINELALKNELNLAEVLGILELIKFDFINSAEVIPNEEVEE